MKQGMRKYQTVRTAIVTVKTHEYWSTRTSEAGDTGAEKSEANLAPDPGHGGGIWLVGFGREQVSNPLEEGTSMKERPEQRWNARLP